jgi:catechol 2,3-dioxygenase-like lactoylglutathione lyase family enzyme
MAAFPPPFEDGLLLTHYIVSQDVERSRRFYTEVLGGETVMEGEPSIVALGNGWIIINTGGAPTDDKPNITLEVPSDLNRVSAFLNFRVADIHAVYNDGAHVELRLLPHRSIAVLRSVAIYAIQMAT